VIVSERTSRSKPEDMNTFLSDSAANRHMYLGGSRQYQLSHAAEIRSQDRHRSVSRQKMPGTRNKRSRVMHMLDDVTRNDRIELSR